MKKTNIYSMLLLASGLTFGLAACEDEVLVETKDETKANELLTAIAAADEQLATLSVENNTLTVSNAQAEKLIEQYADLREELVDPYSDPTEVHYTVTVLSSSNAVVSSGRSKGFEGATVVVEQNGLVLEPSSSSNGLYLFTGLKSGYVYVRVSAADHTSVEYRAYIYLND
ncbi:MAG: carboxypeptidase-like regulatory domain-containing protein, partial [Chryseosolibacter sp.]